MALVAVGPRAGKASPSPVTAGPPFRRVCNCRTGASPTTSSNLITISSSFCAGSRARPEICAAKKSTGGNVFEGSRQREYPEPADDPVVCRRTVREGGENPRLSPFPRAFGQRVSALRQSRRRGLWRMPLLRLLRTLRLRGERQGEPAFHSDPARGAKNERRDTYKRARASRSTSMPPKSRAESVTYLDAADANSSNRVAWWSLLPMRSATSI